MKAILQIAAIVAVQMVLFVCIKHGLTAMVSQEPTPAAAGCQIVAEMAGTPTVQTVSPSGRYVVYATQNNPAPLYIVKLWLWDAATGATRPVETPEQTDWHVAAAVTDGGIVTGTSRTIGRYGSIIWQWRPIRVVGDIDLDGDVDMNDFGLVQRCLGGSAEPRQECERSDLDNDGDVDSDDLHAVRNRIHP